MRSHQAIALVGLAALALTGWVMAGPQPVFEDIVISASAGPLEGEVQPMSEILKAKGLKHDDDDATAGSVGFVDKQGKVYSLLKTEASRMLFVDSRLHKRPLRLLGKVVPGTQLIQVEQVQSLKEGKAFVVDYWCPNCELRYLEPGECMCCGNEVNLRELPAPALKRSVDQSEKLPVSVEISQP